MKAKIKDTGQVINVTWDNGPWWHYENEAGYSCHYRSDEIIPLQYSSEELKVYNGELVLADNGIDWEKRRYEIARTMLPFVDRKKYITDKVKYDFNVDEAAKDAVRFADALIKELKRKEND